MRKIKFDSAEELDKDCKKFVKRKCTSLYDDIEIFKKALRVKIPEHQSTKQIDGLGNQLKFPFTK